MTQARTRTSGLVTPSLSQLWLTAMLRAFVELVHNAASTLRMVFTRKLRDWHTQPAQDVLPEATTGIQHQEPSSSAQQGSPIALMLRDRDLSRRSRKAKAEAIVSKHEGVLTNVSPKLAHHRDRPFLAPLIPAKAGTQSRNGIPGHARHARTPPRIPIYIGMGGETVHPSAPA